jgi:ribosomal protein S18 acetylase RimI-like enzyme
MKTGNQLLVWLCTTTHQNVETHPNAQRLGVANTLLHESKSIAKEKGIALPRHSSNRTDEGNKWAKATGDNVPKRKRPR